MLALLHHFLAGSFLLLSIFAPTIDAKAKCVQGGVCYGKDKKPAEPIKYDEFLPSCTVMIIVIAFYCLNEGGVKVGYGCISAIIKNCPHIVDDTLNKDYNEVNRLYGDDFVVMRCADDLCHVANSDEWVTEVNYGINVFHNIFEQATVDTCEFHNPLIITTTTTTTTSTTTQPTPEDSTVPTEEPVTNNGSTAQPSANTKNPKLPTEDPEGDDTGADEDNGAAQSGIQLVGMAMMTLMIRWMYVDLF